MVVEVDAGPGDGGGHAEAAEAPGNPLGHAHGCVVPPTAAASRGPVAHDQEQGERDGEVGDELRVRAGHAVALAVHAAWTLLLDQPLEGEIEGLAQKLPREHEGHLGLARRPYEGGVDDTEALRDEREPGAQVRDRVGGIL